MLPAYQSRMMGTGYTENMRQPDHSSVKHTVVPPEYSLLAIIKALRLPSCRLATCSYIGRINAPFTQVQQLLTKYKKNKRNTSAYQHIKAENRS